MKRSKTRPQTRSRTTWRRASGANSYPTVQFGYGIRDKPKIVFAILIAAVLGVVTIFEYLPTAQSNGMNSHNALVLEFSPRTSINWENLPISVNLTPNIIPCVVQVGQSPNCITGVNSESVCSGHMQCRQNLDDIIPNNGHDYALVVLNVETLLSPAEKYVSNLLDQKGNTYLVGPNGDLDINTYFLDALKICRSKCDPALNVLVRETAVNRSPFWAEKLQRNKLNASFRTVSLLSECDRSNLDRKGCNLEGVNLWVE